MLLPFFVSLKLACVSVILLLLITLPLAYYFAYASFPGKIIFESLFLLPVFLPPTVLGFYLLVLFSPRYPFGAFLKSILNVELAFSFSGIVIASSIFVFPNIFKQILGAYRALPNSFIEASYTLGASPVETFFRVILPNISPFVIVASLTSFAQVIGGFGVVLMVGGNIEGVTKVASIALYEKVESFDFASAHKYSLYLLLFSFIILLAISFIEKILIKRDAK